MPLGTLENSVPIEKSISIKDHKLRRTDLRSDI